MHNSISGTCSSQLEDSVICSDEEGPLASSLPPNIDPVRSRFSTRRIRDAEKNPVLLYERGGIVRSADQSG